MGRSRRRWCAIRGSVRATVSGSVQAHGSRSCRTLCSLREAGDPPSGVGRSVPHRVDVPDEFFDVTGLADLAVRVADLEDRFETLLALRPGNQLLGGNEQQFPGLVQRV